VSQIWINSSNSTWTNRCK